MPTYYNFEGGWDRIMADLNSLLNKVEKEEAQRRTEEAAPKEVESKAQLKSAHKRYLAGRGILCKSKT